MPRVEIPNPRLMASDGHERCLLARSQCGGNHIVADMPFGDARTAQELSRVLGGQWWPGRGSVTWRNGSRTAWIVCWEQARHVEACHRVLENLGIEARPWTVGACARGILKWIGASQRPEASAERLRCPEDWGFCRVDPGSYASASLWDMDAAYWRLALRLPSPCVLPLSDSLAWLVVEPDTLARWRDALCAIGSSKPLRNALVGAMIGAAGRNTFYTRGEAREGPRTPGSLRPAGLLIARTCYELCGLQACAAGCVYANTDCVILPGSTRPRLWEHQGVQCSLRASGPADVRGLGVYRCGSAQTELYGCRLPENFAPVRSPIPRRLVSSLWL